LRAEKNPANIEKKPIYAKISFNATKSLYPLYTVRILRDIAKEIEIKQGDQLAFFKEKTEDGWTLRAELKRGKK
jgi:hypothetical protein